MLAVGLSTALAHGESISSGITARSRKEATTRAQVARARFDDAFQEGVTRTSLVIQTILGKDCFREAVTWQNRNAWHGGLAALIRHPIPTGERNARRRQNEALVASYLQRYCTKNDTIGFFGPVGWATLRSDEGPTLVEPGPDLVTERAVYFEGWCIDALSRRISGDRRLRPWFPPRLLPTVHLGGDTLTAPGYDSVPLSPRLVSLLHACDGERTAMQVASNLLDTSASSFSNESEVFHALDECCRMGLIAWNLDIALDAHPERELRRLLERVEEVDQRTSAIGLIDDLNSARERVAAASGDPERLDQALGEMSATFTAITGLGATREPGKTYGARALVYEDCRRDINVEIGRHLQAELASPLALLLTSARWLTYEAAQVFRTTLRNAYAEITHITGSNVIDAISLGSYLAPSLSGTLIRDIDSLVASYQERWSAILEPALDERCITYTSEPLRSRVLSNFDAPHAGWQGARYHSPDVLIAAQDVAALQGGEFQFVLGELHLAQNTLCSSSWVTQHPKPEELFRAMDIDLTEPLLVYDIPKGSPGLTSRTRRVLTPSNAWTLAFGSDPPSAARSRVIPISALVLEMCEDTLMVRTRDHRLRFDLIEAFSDTIAYLLRSRMGHLGLLQECDHTPRIAVDRLVISREMWRFSPKDVLFASERDEASRYLAARNWARSIRLPRFVFVRVPNERKPVYVDFESPVLVELMAKMVRHAAKEGNDASISITEMLPRPDQAWLPDSQDRRYTSELRMVAVDLELPVLTNNLDTSQAALRQANTTDEQ